MRRIDLIATAMLTMVLVPLVGAAEDGPAARTLPQFMIFPDPSGQFATYDEGGRIDLNNPFFQDLGSNGRRCVTCHQPQDAWTVIPPHIRARFELTRGQDPIFRTNDGSNCTDLDVSTLSAKRRAYSLLLNKGLIRVEMAVPATAEFAVLHVENPYGCSSDSKLSVYRRPLPASNLPFLSAVMWDGRETFAGKSIFEDLGHQAMDATLGHAQAAQAPSDAQVQSIVDFELQLYTAQLRDEHAGLLNVQGATGGVLALSQQDFFPGINDSLGLNPTGAAFNPKIFDLFDAWAARAHRGGQGDAHQLEARQAVVRGQNLFNTLPITLTGVGGLNDTPLPFDGQVHPVIQATCGTCHDSPNVGDHSLPAPLNIGLTDVSRRTPDLPLFTLENRSTGEVVQTTDPGRALVTGKWADIGKFKGPILRGLAARAPYFHNGSAATLMDVVDFYDTRFALHLSTHDKADLVAFLATL